MSSFDAVINLKANDQASPVVDAATKNILNNYKVMRQEIKSVTAEFQLQNQSLIAAANAFRSVGSIAGSFMNVFTQFQTMQIRVTDANNRLILAQLHYNQVLSEQGPGTNDAIAASIQLQEAKTGVAQATQQETIGYIGMGLELGSAVSQIINAIPVFERLITKLGAVKTAAVVANAALGGVGAGGTTGKVAGAAESAASSAVGTTATTATGGGLGALAAKLGKSALKILPKAGVAAAGVELLSMMGSQQAGGGENETAGGGTVATGIDALSEIAGQVSSRLSDFGDKLSNFFEGKGFVNSPGAKVEHVVTVRVENPSDHIVTAQEKAMGIQQVYQSGQ